MASFKQFLLSMLKVGCIGFGGGSALIPVIEDEIITKQQLDTKKNYDQDVVVASITPGALPVELAASLGKRNFGSKGMFLAALAMALPGAFVAVLLLSVFSTMQAEFLAQIEIASIGVSSFIMYLLTCYITNVMKQCRDENTRRLTRAIVIMLLVMLLAFGKNLYKLLNIKGTPIFSVSTFHILLAAFFFILYTRGQLNKKHIIISGLLSGIYLLGHGKAQLISNVIVLRITELLMLALAIYGVSWNMKKSKRKYPVNKRAMINDVVVWLVIFILFSIPAVVLYFSEAALFIRNGIVSAIMSFGGGDAYLTVAEGLFVESDMITESQYFGQIVTVVNILPGSILCKTLAGVGYYLGFNTTGSMTTGILFATLGFVCSIAVSCGFFAIIYHTYDSLNSLHVFRLISRWIRPIIAGLLINIMLSLCNQNIAASEAMGCSSGAVIILTLLLYWVDYVLGRKYKVSSLWLLGMNLVIVFGLHFIS